MTIAKIKSRILSFNTTYYKSPNTQLSNFWCWHITGSFN